ncbi:MAG TPA: MBL fold metallo-hydrolase [Terriglobales bacterium]|nr:MBL fold metallo-hydrolase [Terriglobales bacterium]
MLAALVFGLVPGAWALPCPATPAIAALEHQGLEFVNATRADPRYRAETEGRARPLTLDPRAAEVARCHSEFMARAHTLSHSGPAGATPGDRLGSDGIAWTAVGENVAMAADLATADGILMKEPPFQPNHRANILNPKFTRVGIGVARSSDGLVWVTEDFYTPDRGGRAALPRGQNRREGLRISERAGRASGASCAPGEQPRRGPGEAQRRFGATGPQAGASISGTRGVAALGPAPTVSAGVVPVDWRGPRPVQPKMQLVLLGTGSPVADPERWGPAAAVLVNGESYLVDAGVGVVRRASAAAHAGHPELRVRNLKRVFLTHLHSDHTLGLPDLLLSPWVLGRRTGLVVYGPRGTSAMVSDIMQAWRKDIAVRTQGLEHEDAAMVRPEVHEIGAGEIYRDANVAVTAFLVHHGSWDEALGYTFQTSDRRIVFSGDTSPVASVAQACAGCDVLVHEVYLGRGVKAREPGQRQYFREFHTSAEELCGVAKQARPKLLLLDHQIFEGRPEAELLAAVRACYSGAVESGRDLGVY